MTEPDYVQYVTGIENSNANSYNFLVSGRDAYASSSGIMIKGDTSANPGLGIRMDSNNNTFVDHRTKDNKPFTFRLHDHDTNTVIPLLVLKRDDQKSDSVAGADLTGRIKASQFHLGNPDTRGPMNSGLYISADNNYTAQIKINKGDGVGGFDFTTHAADGSVDKVNMLLNDNGTVTIPQYNRTADAYDDENYAIAGFDSTGKLVRAYQQNRRFQSVESRTTAAEGDKTDTAIRINEIIRRINSLSIFSAEMAELALTPGFTFPQAGLYLQDTGMTNIDGSFNAYVVYPDFRAYQLNSTNLMITGDPLTVPFEKSSWTRIGDYIEGDKFTVSAYYQGTPLQQALEKSLASAKKIENYSSTVQYTGLSPWTGAKWMSTIEVR